MANLDTIDRRASGYNFGLPFVRALPWPGTDSNYYRYHLLNLYSGISAITVLDMPDGRTMFVAADSRIYSVPEDVRIWQVLTDSRIYSVPEG